MFGPPKTEHILLEPSSKLQPLEGIQDGWWTQNPTCFSAISAPFLIPSSGCFSMSRHTSNKLRGASFRWRNVKRKQWVPDGHQFNSDVPKAPTTLWTQTAFPSSLRKVKHPLDLRGTLKTNRSRAAGLEQLRSGVDSTNVKTIVWFNAALKGGITLGKCGLAWCSGLVDLSLTFPDPRKMPLGLGPHMTPVFKIWRRACPPPPPKRTRAGVGGDVICDGIGSKALCCAVLFWTKTML